MVPQRFLVFVLALTVLCGHCSGWSVVMGSGTEHIRLYESGSSWTTAKQECAAEGGSLAIIKDHAVHEEVFQNVPHASSLWIGGQRTSNQRWAWLETGRITTISRSSGFLQESTLYNCAYLRVEDVNGNRMAYIKGDMRCDKKLPFICKRQSSGCNINSEDCYFTPSSGYLSWERAQQECRYDRSSNLASFTSNIDTRSPLSRYRRIETEQLGRGVEPGNYWIGLRYTGWTWHDGSELIYSSGTELSRPAPNTNLNCLQMKTDGVWAPAECINLLHFLCYFDEPDPNYEPEDNRRADDLQNLPWVVIVSCIAAFVVVVFFVLLGIYCWCRNAR